MMHWKEFGRKQLWPHWGRSICMKRLKERISPNRLCPNQDLKSAPSQKKINVTPICPVILNYVRASCFQMYAVITFQTNNNFKLCIYYFWIKY